MKFTYQISSYFAINNVHFLTDFELKINKTTENFNNHWINFSNPAMKMSILSFKKQQN